MKRTRSRMALFVSLGVLLLCAACGAGGNEPAPAAEETSNIASNATQTVTPSAADKQRVVKSMKGDITVPADPARVIGTTVTYPEFLFALGITPVAAENYHEEFPSYFNGAFKEVIDLGAVDSPNFEAVLAAEPDLILAPAWRDEKSYDQLAKIAPTVLLPNRDDWRDELRDIGEALGRMEKAEQAIQEYERTTGEAKEKLHTLIGDETVAYMRITPKGVFIYGAVSSRGRIIHEELGLKPVEAFPKEESTVQISLEILPEYNPDHIILQVDSGSEAEQARMEYENMAISSIWKNLNAVKNGHVYLVGDNEWFNFGFSPVANTYAIDEIVKVIEQNN